LGGIAYIAAVAREAGFAVDIIDMCGEGIDQTQIIQEKYIAYGISNAELETRLKPSKVIGFTCMLSQDWIFIREIIKKVRELAPESLPLAGSEHITAIPELDLASSGKASRRLPSSCKKSTRDKTIAK
tara:strand:+ start:399 stop:782 length:384 start_codon:yes stop_codon:yes gene_type:complete